MSDLQNGNLGGNAKALVTERSHKCVTEIQLHSSTVDTTTRYGRKGKPPNRNTPGASNNLSYNLGSSNFDEIETVAYNRYYVDHELPKSIEEALFPEWYRATKAE